MPISADTERELLNKYKLTSLYPTEWPHQDDDDDDDYDDEIEDAQSPTKGHNRNVSRDTANSRFQKISRHASLKSSITGKTANSDVGVQKDEPDALGMAPSVAAELRKRGLPVEDNLVLRNKFMTSSTTFNPALYLSQVHQQASTEDLLRGLDFLSRSIEQKSASLKVLVESNFERFVRAKATIDTVYTEMRTQGVEPTRLSQMPAAGSGLRPHSRQTSKNQSHFRNTSGPFGSQAKIPQVDKKKTALTKESEYGVQGIKAPLQEVAIKAEEVWGPALGGHEKEETLKSVLSSLEQYRDIFRLPGTVYEAVKKNDYDSVVAAYKQAKQHADKARDIAAIAKDNGMELGDADVQQIIVTARMWHAVNEQVDSFKQEVWRRLKNSHGRRPSSVAEESDRELHMELIAVLLQLGAEENPIWVWINSRYLYLKDRIARSFERSRIEIEIQRRKLATSTKADNFALAKHLRAASANNNTLRLHSHSSRDLDTENVLAFWDKVQGSVAGLLSPQNGVLGEVLDWHESAQSFVDNKAQKSFPTAVFAMQDYTHLQLSQEHIDAIRKDALEIVVLLRDNVNALFQDAPVDDISDLYSPIPPTPISPDSKTPISGLKRSFSFDPQNIPPPSPKVGNTWETYAFWPPGANSLSGSFYLARLVAITGTAFGELAALSTIKMSNEPEKLKNTLVAARERCITGICASWSADAERCKVLESWTRSPERRDLTLLPNYFEAWFDKVLSNVQKIAYISDASSKSGDVIVPPSAKLLQAVRSTFVTSLYKGLNGMVENAERTKRDSAGLDEDADPDGITVARYRQIEVDGAASLGSEALDASNRNERMLISLSNLNHLRSEVIPQLISQFESAFSVKLTEESKTIRDVLAQIDARLFQSYVKPLVESLTTTITAGVTSPSWTPATPRPTDARAYVYDVLISLVLVHAEVTSATTNTLTNQILSYMLEQSSLALINAFKLRQHYTLPALMQATLDVEFMAQTLNNYTTDKAGEIQSQIYLALDERTDNDARAKLQGELPEMRGILKKLREGTKGEFGCFRRERRRGREGGKA
ncbi:Putative exocyst complex component EXOC2/Sec5 [Septoria linicola]|uniref:Exocyst complex component SEC5 n=1 Tax=Septoria linicola TaxID=215465 RepID=A0A9Q9EGS4_9PEZI|nr:Putative exocyst complex component EXOC2/Sec5 [Septoria linicola]